MRSPGACASGDWISQAQLKKAGARAPAFLVYPWSICSSMRLLGFADRLIEREIERVGSGEVAAPSLFVVDLEAVDYDRVLILNRLFNHILACDLDTAIVVHARTGRDEAAHDDVLLEAAQ